MPITEQKEEEIGVGKGKLNHLKAKHCAKKQVKSINFSQDYFYMLHQIWAL